ncbi:hypothetical protein ACKGJN_11440 [Gillisia sp. Q332]|uniref:hypothetical protein n=1 Tax=Gillisia xinjiangensis TaxID=3384765 RepID=UPI00391A9C96
MPMPDNGFQWRPNDNSARTNLRYTLEAEKWVNAVSSVQRKAQPRSISGDLAFISMVFQLVFSVSLLILLGILQLVTGLVRLVESGLQNNSGGTINEARNPGIENGEGKEPDAIWDITNEKQYPKGWQLIFYTDWGRLRHIWQFLYLLVFIFIILLVVLWLLSLWIPDYVHINKEVLIFAGGISLWNAFLGVDD